MTSTMSSHQYQRPSEYKVDGKLIWHKEKIALVISIVAVFVSLFSFLIVAVVTLQGQKKTYPAVSDSQYKDLSPIACIECRLLLLDETMAIEEDPLVKKLSRTHYAHDQSPKCCAFDSNQMSAMMEATIRRREPPKINLTRFDADDFKFSPASAHMRFYPPVGDNKKGPIFTPKLLPVTFREPNEAVFNEHAKGVNVTREGLRIMFTGLYMVYSSIEYEPDYAGGCSGLTYQNWSHYVRVRSGQTRYEKTLLQTAQTCCDSCYHNEDSKFTSGVFQLNAGDLVSVKVMGYGLYHYGRDTSYLGVAMLGAKSDE